ncbi:hypothetical protein BKK56_02645 [Rodentibacter genomosp. 2]|uniref:hypothetical protein n=1 Tax=Rodentibacter genomosp. 2 TaxID=1908266 RepID=UPI000985F074|nr:hypothetical protein BKK56_02645 [Rodentibacter genomosp. 2]
MIFKKLLFPLFLLFCSFFTHSNDISQIKDEYGNTIFFKSDMAYDQSIDIIQQDKNGLKNFLFKLPYLAESPVIYFSYFRNIKGKGYYLIVSSTIKPGFNKTGIPYVDDYFSYYFFKLNNQRYEFDQGLSDYFGEGGDIYDLNDINNDKVLYPNIIYSYPFKNRKDIDNELDGVLFREWNSGSIKDGRIINKTFFQDVPNYVQEERRYLIKGDKFKVKSISARWLEIVYKNPKGKYYTGWVLCKDTSICE